MRTFTFLIILTAIVLIYSLLNYYILRRALQALPESFPYRIWLIIGFIIIAYSFLIGRFLENPLNTDITYYFIWLGSFWLGAFIYFIIIIVALDLLRFSNHYLHYFPQIITTNWQKTKLITLIASISLVILIMLIGYINNFFPKIKYLDIKVPKKSAQLDEMKIVFISDIHLGVSTINKQLDILEKEINAIHPDLVLIAGDILDEDANYLIKNELGQQIKRIQSKYGIWGITGNHEFIGGIHSAEKYIEKLGIKLLRDDFALIANSINLVGREDLSAKNFIHKGRMPLDELINKSELEYPTILMDHQPFRLDEVAEYPVDLQISGHTHHGQIFPFNFITSAIYKKSFGYIKVKNTNFYVSAGFGVWGPPIRTVSRPEIIVINIKFK
ncbi:MAG: hypothetical protein A2X64_00795 [Ignavibacteria bacterium GWF2_33_9]|nr:MAG: hypothetical protein A2X64_00795 [Ignavibacteria bacterium GWF2_33_9]